MNYSSIASSIRSAISSLEQCVSDVKSISFSGVWSGDAYNNLSSNLNTSISNINTQKDESLKYADALDKLQEYKDKKETYDNLNNELNGIPNNAENASARHNLINEINSLGTSLSSLKSEIQSLLSGISSVGTEFEIINYQVSDNYSEYVVDLYDFLNLFNSGTLTKMPDSGTGSSLYDYYSKEEVDTKFFELKKYKDPDVRYYACVVDKNRAGAKPTLLFRLNLAYNVWEELRIFKTKTKIK